MGYSKLAIQNLTFHNTRTGESMHEFYVVLRERRSLWHVVTLESLDNFTLG